MAPPKKQRSKRKQPAKRKQGAGGAAIALGDDVLDSLTKGVFAFDAGWRFTFVNSAGERILGRTKRSLLGRELWTEFPDLAATTFGAAYRRAVAEGAPQVVEDFYQPFNGWFQARALPSARGMTLLFRDVTTEHRQRDILKGVADNATLGLLMMDEHHHCTFMNAAAEAITGFTLDEVRGKPLHEFIHHTRPDGRPYPLSECPIDRALPTRARETGEEIFVRKDGSFYPVAFTASPIVENGRPVGTIIELRNTTDEKRAKELLRASEERFRTMVDAMPQLAWIADVDGAIHWYNRRWYEYTGTTHAEMEDEGGWGWKKVHDPTQLDRVVARFQAAIASGESWEDTFPLRRKDGELRAHLSRATPLRDETGRIVQWFGTNTDVEEQRRAEVALKASEARLQAIIDNAPDVICLKDLNDQLLVVNRAYEELIGRSRAELLGKKDHDLFPGSTADAFVANAAALASNERIQTEEILPRGDGVRTFSSVKFPLIDADGRPYAIGGISTDVTEQKAAENQRRHVIEFQERLIGIASHDIRSPTAAILTTAQMLLLRGDLDASLRRPLERIARSAVRIEGLIRTVLDYTTARLGDGIPVRTRESDLKDAVLRAIREHEEAAATRKIVVESTDTIVGSWDVERLGQAVASLLDNALKYGDPSQPVRVSLRAESGEAVLDVRNAGPPIASTLRSTLFEPFQRGEQQDQTVKLSLGLGLYLVREVVRAHGGQVYVESEVELGTTFRIRLPIEVPKDAQQQGDSR